MILGYKIRVWTDHTAIQNLFKHKNLRGRVARWFATLQNYEVTFEYIPGKKNSAADALSRNISQDHDVTAVVCSVEELISLADSVVKEEQKIDKTWSSLVEHLTNPELTPRPKLNKKIKVEEYELIDGLLYRNTVSSDTDTSRGKVKQLVIPES